jgi:hypothetical protein
MGFEVYCDGCYERMMYVSAEERADQDRQSKEYEKSEGYREWARTIGYAQNPKRYKKYLRSEALSNGK